MGRSDVRQAFGTGLACLGLAIALAAAGCGGRGTLARTTPATPAPRLDPFQYTPIQRSGQPAAPPPVRALALPSARPGWEPTVAQGPWQWIVIHHSATATGNAAIFDEWHRTKRHWDELGYHFVIGNGTASGDGQVEIGPRWFKQKHGAHCRVGNNETYNDTGIGICLVGDFQKTRPTQRQMQALAELVDWLSLRFGIPESHVIGHGAVDVTSCPGRYFSMDDLARRVAALRRSRLALAGTGR